MLFCLLSTAIFVHSQGSFFLSGIVVHPLEWDTDCELPFFTLHLAERELFLSFLCIHMSCRLPFDNMPSCLHTITPDRRLSGVKKRCLSMSRWCFLRWHTWPGTRGPFLGGSQGGKESFTPREDEGPRQVSQSPGCSSHRTRSRLGRRTGTRAGTGRSFLRGQALVTERFPNANVGPHHGRERGLLRGWHDPAPPPGLAAPSAICEEGAAGREAEGCGAVKARGGVCNQDGAGCAGVEGLGVAE